MQLIFLKDALENLSKPANEQVDYLRTLFEGIWPKVNIDRCLVDELTIEFFDSAINIEIWLEGGIIDNDASEMIDRLKHEIDRMIRMDKELWTVRSLKCDSQWDRIRDLARACLERLELR